MSKIDIIGVTNENSGRNVQERIVTIISAGRRISLIKTSYGRNKKRLLAGKKTINVDERYMSAEKFLYGELAVVMEIPRDKVSGYVKEHGDAEPA